MSKLKIERGVSRTERVKLQVSIEQPLAHDIELMAQWSDNEKNYIVNELLSFALEQATDFQEYKRSLNGKPAVSVPSPQKIPGPSQASGNKPSVPVQPQGGI
jgi:hypothetical protein